MGIHTIQTSTCKSRRFILPKRNMEVNEKKRVKVEFLKWKGVRILTNSKHFFLCKASKVRPKLGDADPNKPSYLQSIYIISTATVLSMVLCQVLFSEALCPDRTVAMGTHSMDSSRSTKGLGMAWKHGLLY